MDLYRPWTARRAFILAYAIAAAVVLAAPGAAQAAFGLTKLRAGSITASENYLYTTGGAVTTEASVDSGRYYRVFVRDPAGGLRSSTVCQPSPAGDKVNATYTVQPTDPVSGSTGWRYELQQFDGALCSGAPAKAASLYFSVARATAYTSPSLLTQTSVYRPGATGFVRVSGAGKLKSSPTTTGSTDWDVSWITPSGTTACANTGGGDRPDSSAGGSVPVSSTSWLQYPPNVAETGDPWNNQPKYEARPCTALTLANQGQWKLRIEQDATHFVTLSAFVNDDAPPAPVITSAEASPGSNRNPAWSFTGEPGATFECRLQRGTTDISAWSACSSPRSHDLSAQPDATYAFSVRARSASGATGPAATATYVLDASLPASPQITSAPASPGSDSTPAWTVSAASGTTLTCRLDRGPTQIAGWAPCAGITAYDLTLQPDGGYTFSVRATSSTGVTGGPLTSDYSLDRVAPGVPNIYASPASPGTDRRPSWSFLGEPGDTFECQLERDGLVVFGWAGCSDPAVYDLTAEPDGTWRLLVRATDPAGNMGPAQSSDYVLNAGVPAAPSFTAEPPATGSSYSPAWSFASDAGATFECREESGGAVLADWAPCASPRTYSLTGRVDGTYDLLVRAISSTGVTGPATIGTYVLDTVSPGAPIFTRSPPAAGSDETVVWSFAGEAGATFECRIDRGATAVFSWAPCRDAAGYDLAGEPDGTYTFSVRADDEAGNTSEARTGDYDLDRVAPAPPVIVTPPASPASDPQPSWAFTGEPAANFECRIDRGATAVAGWAPCSSPRAYDLTGEPYATYTFSVRTADAAGNRSAVVTSDYVLAPDPPANTQAPAVAGAERDGETLTADDGTWTGTPTLTFARRWLRCDAGGAGCTEIPSATGDTYRLTAGDVGATLRIRVTAGNAGGERTATSTPTGVVVADGPTSTSEPTTSGEAMDGATLTAQDGVWTGTPQLRFSYQWRRCTSDGCADDPGATGSTYSPVSEDIGSTLRVVVTASNDAGSAIAVSGATAVVRAAPPVNVERPTTRGERGLGGDTLVAEGGYWTGTRPLELAYTWERCDEHLTVCNDVAGVTGKRYPLTAQDLGRRLRVVVTGTNAAGTATARSEPTPAYQAPPEEPDATAPPVNPDPVTQTTPTDPAAQPTPDPTLRSEVPAAPAALVPAVPALASPAVPAAGATRLAGSLVSAAACQTLASGAGIARIDLPESGPVRLRLQAYGMVTPEAPVMVSLSAARLSRLSVRFSLDGRTLKAAVSPREHRLALKPAELRAVGEHRLTVDLKRPGGATRRMVMTLRTVPCQARFTTAFYKTRGGTTLRLRMDSQRALAGVRFGVPRALALGAEPKARLAGRLRIVATGGRSSTVRLTLPARARSGALLSRADGLAVRFTTTGVSVEGLPRETGIAELTIFGSRATARALGKRHLLSAYPTLRP